MIAIKSTLNIVSFQFRTILVASISHEVFAHRWFGTIITNQQFHFIKIVITWSYKILTSTYASAINEL